MFQPLSRSRKHQVVMCYAPDRFYFQKQVEEAQGVVDNTTQELQETNDKIKSLRLQLSTSMEESAKFQLEKQIRRLTVKELSLRRRLRRNKSDRQDKLATLHHFDRYLDIKQQLDTINLKQIELQSAIQSHKKALKKAKKEETKAAHNLKITNLEEEYKELFKKECTLKRQLKKLRHFEPQYSLICADSNRST